jgi:hypothetical protein
MRLDVGFVAQENAREIIGMPPGHDSSQATTVQSNAAAE